MDSYEINRIDLEVLDEDGVSQEFREKVETFVIEINHKLNSEHQYSDMHGEKGWQVFYVYKEIIQYFANYESDEKFNFFRGQTNSWELTPSLFRDDYSSLAKCFEETYFKIAAEYPNEIEYYGYSSDNIMKRAQQLSMMQHYGLPTSLVDITRNPYIALQFMVGTFNTTEVSTMRFDLFKIDEVEHAKKNIFIDVIKYSKNKRITAQKGDFLDFDYIYDIKETDIKKIDRIVVDLIVDDPLEKENQESNLNADNDLFKNVLFDEDSDYETFFDFTKQSFANDSQKEKDKQLAVIEMIHKEINKKLKEYFYLEKNLYPDFFSRIQYLAKRFRDEKKKINF